MSHIARDFFTCQSNYFDALFLYGDSAICTNWALGALRAQAGYLIQRGI